MTPVPDPRPDAPAGHALRAALRKSVPPLHRARLTTADVLRTIGGWWEFDTAEGITTRLPPSVRVAADRAATDARDAAPTGGDLAEAATAVHAALYGEDTALAAALTRLAAALLDHPTEGTPPPVATRPDTDASPSPCVCVMLCDPAAHCALAREWHVHPDVTGPCPVHPDAPQPRDPKGKTP